MIQQGLKFKLDTDEIIEEIFMKHCGCSRKVYNYFLGEYIRAIEDRYKFLKYSQMGKMLTGLKKNPEYFYLKEIESSSLQNSLRNLDQALKNHRNNPGHFGKPRFKNKYRAKKSFTISNNNNNCFVNIRNELYIAKIGPVKIVKAEKVLTRLPKKYKLTSIVISKDSDQHWYATLKIENYDEIIIPEIKDEIIGIDLGIKNNYTMSYSFEGQFVNEVKDNPKAYAKLEKRIKKLSQDLSRKVKGSRNYEKAKIKLAKMHFKIKTSRTNFNHQLSSSIIKNSRLVVIEDLDLKGMIQKNKSLAKRFTDNAFYQLRQFLEYKCKWYNREIIIVDRYFASSKTCSNCGNIKKNLDISDRTYTCEKCRNVEDRDINASNNLYNIGYYKMTHGKVLNQKEYSSWRETEWHNAA